MKGLIQFIKGIANIVTFILVAFYMFAWLFNIETSRIWSAIEYSSFVWLVTWFILLLFFKRDE